MESSVKSILFSILEIIESIWRFKVATIDSNHLTVANIVIALTIFLVGFKFSKKFSHFVVHKVSGFSKLNANDKYLFESFIFYLLLVIFLLMALNVAQIPTGVFAFLGGALAIGFGFGSQNIIKNFISGIILMLEQPIRVGDMIEVEKTQGRVIKIGARSTHITTYDNYDILVPNSILLENNLVNWTLTDDRIRTNIKVGVAYGSDTKKVASLLLEIAKDNKNIFNDPKPVVFFREFADSSLIFELQFWVKMTRPADKNTVESDIRYTVDEVFHKNGITIAFPQLDVHLHKMGP